MSFSRYYINGLKDSSKHFLHTALDAEEAKEMAAAYLSLFSDYDEIEVMTLDEEYRLVIGRDI